MSFIVTPPPDSPLEDARTRRLTRLDACPQGCDNYELPTAIADALDGFTASYTCARCRHSWITNWAE